MLRITTQERIHLYCCLIADVEASFRGEPAHRNSLDRLRRMLGHYGEVHEVLEEADRKVFRLYAELSQKTTFPNQIDQARIAES